MIRLFKKKEYIIDIGNLIPTDNLYVLKGDGLTVQGFTSKELSYSHKTKEIRDGDLWWEEISVVKAPSLISLSVSLSERTIIEPVMFPKSSIVPSLRNAPLFSSIAKRYAAHCAKYSLP